MEGSGGRLTRRALGLLFSVAVHGALAGTIFGVSAGKPAPPPEQIYRVSLAELAPPEPPVTIPEPEPPPEPPPPEPPPPPPPPEPVVEPPKPQPPAKKPQAKKISPKKQPDRPKEKPVEAPPAPPPPPPVASAPPRPAAPPANPNAVYRQDRVDQRPAIAKQVSPKYPQKARRMNVEGQVMVQLVVDKSGQARDCRVISANPPGYFEDAALEAAVRTRFVPGKIKGQAVNTLVVIPFAFRLR